MFCGFETAFILSQQHVCESVIIVQETLEKEIRLKQVIAFHKFFLSLSLTLPFFGRIFNFFFSFFYFLTNSEKKIRTKISLCG